MPEAFTPLPLDFKDRPRHKRWLAHFLVLSGLKPIKAVCCENFRKDKVACKGCATLYDKTSPNWWHRFIATHGKRKTLPTEPPPAS